MSYACALCRRVVELDLTRVDVGDEACVQLTPALSESRSLRRLRCPGAGLGPHAIQAWATALMEGDVGPRITELDLSDVRPQPGLNEATDHS